MIALLTGAAGAAGMQFAHAAETETLAQTELTEVIVTGSRVIRDGYNAPTPLTVVGSEEMAQQASPKVIDYLTSLPAFSGNLTPASGNTTISAGMAGTSTVNLRDLTPDRTLVLIDGQRAVGSTVTGRVDINSIPSQLIERVEIVTGGASAAYGSDAVSGVVNFILDKDFTGFKAEASGGQTEHSDNRNYDVAMTFGTPFADGRGHFIVSGQNSKQDGILHADRDWVREAAQLMYNPTYTPTNGEPEILTRRHVSPSVLTPGGLIVSGPLRGTGFAEGGAPYPFNYGLVSGDAMSGGDYQLSSLRGTSSLEPELSIQNVFARLSYDVTDDLNVYVQSNWNTNESFGYSYPHDIYYGGLVVPVDNPFLPASVAAQAQSLGLQELELGTSFGDLGSVINNNTRKVLRNVIGFNTRFDALGTDWNWDGYYQYGVSETGEYARHSANFDHLDLALDATRDPVSGEIVCASTLTDPGNGCVPLNPFGTGVNSDAARNYVLGTAHRAQRFKQTVVATSVQGNPFSIWAGPVSVATGVEYRKESVSGSSTELDKQGVFWGGNYLPTFGEYDVTEGFLETVVPLAANQSWAQALDLNAAVRLTDYSTSGSVTTWKLGLVYSPIDDVRFRVTKSRDIRAPNLADLYNAGTRNLDSIIDPSTKGAVAYQGFRGGNENLTPEVADSLGFGVVLQPSFAPGLSASVDYWSIDIEDAISRYTAQNIANFCYQGNESFCAAINDGAPLFEADGANPNAIRIVPFNLANQTARGIDVELGYRLPMSSFNDSWNGNLGLRALGTHFLENKLDDGVLAPNDIVGQNGGNDEGPPDWRWSASATYDNAAFTAVLGARGVSAGVYDHDYIECSSGCPTSTASGRTIDNNRIAGATYFDLSLSYSMLFGAADATEVETFLNIRNLTDKDPVFAPGGPDGFNFNTIPTSVSVYDTHGRVYLVGVRIKM